MFWIALIYAAQGNLISFSESFIAFAILYNVIRRGIEEVLKNRLSDGCALFKLALSFGYLFFVEKCRPNFGASTPGHRNYRAGIFS